MFQQAVTRLALGAVVVSSWCCCCWSVEAASCLRHAKPARKRVKVDGLTLPLGLWVNDWTSAVLASNVFRILAEDVLGYEVILGRLGDSSLHALWALGGCIDTEDCLHDESLKAPVRRYHVALL
eukprot:TRINITY_DN16807_c0_g3_i3.p1 TRINITY_DN16807_c0_g3~~TRINITY_DN16807_c0_g3_i3.p1  ORF type:complete len:124 (+),score=8.50 TRINITY_DN16807_c0_g3_i3:87-458(+)